MITAYMRRLLHIDGDVISAAELAELAELREKTSDLQARIDQQHGVAIRLRRYFEVTNDRNHIGERLNRALRGG